MRQTQDLSTLLSMSTHPDRPANTTLLCVPIMVNTIEQAHADAIMASEHCCDCIEYRADALYTNETDIEPLCELLARAPLPVILTCRPVWEGGHYEGDEATRLALFEAAVAHTHRPAWIDIELTAVQNNPDFKAFVDRCTTSRIILSTHDFDSRPNDLHRRVLSMIDLGASVCKFAFRARSLRDNLEIFDILNQHIAPTIGLGMGPFGLMSRVLAPKYGAYLTFASLCDTSATAPGQPTLNDMTRHYRFGSITPSTTVFGIVGWPIEHSMSPLVHNEGFARCGYNSVYLPMPIAANEDDASTYASFKATLLELIDAPGLLLGGLSVTMPHKTHLVALAREQGWSIDTISDKAGAANTLRIVRTPTGQVQSIAIANTDAAAAIACLKTCIPDLTGQSIAVLGAGGVARSIIVALLEAGAHVTIYNRSIDRAQKLANATGAHARQWDQRTQTDAVVIINATSVGMYAGDAADKSPMPDSFFAHLDTPNDVLVMETVYNPVRTPLLKAASNAGCHTIDGVCMFVEQAALQFEQWTSHRAPRDLFDSLVRTHLS